MGNPKLTGSYYTPEILSDFLVSHVLAKYIQDKSLSVLEPSCGDGQFVKSFFKAVDFQNFTSIDIDLVDIDAEELLKASACVPSDSKVVLNANATDYLEIFLQTPKKYHLVLGNPPYIRKRHMKKEQIDLCEFCHDVARAKSEFFKSKFKINNIWTAFVETAILSLNDSGVLCFVLPSDILQVNYAKEIRDYIKDEFDRVEIFAFNELVFEGIQQDVVAIIGIKKVLNDVDKGFSFYHVETLNDLKKPAFTEKYNNTHRTNMHKWTNYLLSPDDLDFIEKLKNGLPSISDHCAKISAGIVTAANDFFIINKKTFEKNNLDKYSETKPILLKGSVVSDLISFRASDYEALVKGNDRAIFLNIPESAKEQLPTELVRYIEIAEISTDDEKSIDKRFKMEERKYWYHVPNTWISDGLFIKRSNTFPRIIANEGAVMATDSFYRIVPKDNTDIKHIVFSFYNSLTLLLAELEGRYYGGGVLELTPNEFKQLAIPFSSNISHSEFLKLDNMFRRKMEIDLILDYTDGILLKSLAKKDIQRLRDLRMKLLYRRKKQNQEHNELFLEAV